MQRNLLEYLELTAKRLPHKPAICSDEEQLSFSELMAEAKKIGSYLIKIAAYHEPVLIYMKKTPSMLAVMLGIIYSRCYYVPMDDEMPDERVQKIITKTHARYLITDNVENFSAHQISYEGTILSLQSVKQTEIQEELLKKVREKALDIDPIYLLFTSGSTGEPKGVLGHHRGTVDYIDAITGEIPFSEESIIGNQAPFYVDACMRDVFTTLKCGCTTWIIPKENFLFPLKMIDYLNEKRINTICWVASALSLVSSMGTFEDAIPEYIRLIVSGSEVLSPKQYNLWRQALPEARFFNVYGPTETSGASTFFEVKGILDETKPIPIGRAFPNIEVFLLDGDTELREIGKMGEICIRGTGVTHGYFEEAERTKERFVQDPRNHAYHERIYRTGDLAEYDQNGDLLFRGRADYQIKHMGYRIELGEIEAAAAAVVSECGCIHAAQNDKIVLFYSGDIGKRELTVLLKKVLPRYMMPNLIIKEDSLPHLSNGKLNRRGLLDRYQESIEEKGRRQHSSRGNKR
ncbi:MAG: amino acid adenylation domain-containing protein [Lachnospiraceae bacterium]|nr:amino acid adenylation domain-containing protein [Lachnospiraceae bacterium]